MALPRLGYPGAMTIPGGAGSTGAGSGDKTYVPGENEEGGTSLEGPPAGQPQGGQGDLSAEIGRGERATHNPDEDMGDGDGEPFYAG